MTRNVFAVVVATVGLTSVAPTGQQPARYALVVARADGALGPYLHRANLDCATLRATMTATPSRDNPPCNLRRDVGRISASGLPFDQLVGMLGSQGRMQIVDRTGLAGNFDWDVMWAPEGLTADMIARLPRNGATLPSAVEHQLGLRLIPLE